MFVITPFFVTLAVVPPFWNHLGTKHPPTPPFGDEINSTPQTFNMAILFALQRETYPFQGPVRGKPATLSKANERLAECLARQRLESRGALHQAWSEAADASRKAAALERRLQESAGDGDFGNQRRDVWIKGTPPGK